MLEDLKRQVYSANMELQARGLVTYTWGNVSGVDRGRGLIVIKPSGVDYGDLTPDNLVTVDLDGCIVEGSFNPSSDTRTHLALYKAFPEIGGIAHSHSTYATSWAQACEAIPCYGTTHADYFYGAVPCARRLTPEETEADYEGYTGRSIIEKFESNSIDPRSMPGVICSNHGPFTWGKDAAGAVYHAVVLEETAKMALLTRQIHIGADEAPRHIINKHYLRKNGIHAAVVDKLIKGGTIDTTTIANLCALLDCQPGDIMEFVPDESEGKE